MFFRARRRCVICRSYWSWLNRGYSRPWGRPKHCQRWRLNWLREWLPSPRQVTHPSQLFNLWGIDKNRKVAFSLCGVYTGAAPLVWLFFLLKVNTTHLTSLFCCCFWFYNLKQLTMTAFVLLTIQQFHQVISLRCSRCSVLCNMQHAPCYYCA